MPKGFSLVELITVLIILGILAAVATATFRDTGDIQARGYLEDSLSATRYAQRLAVASGCAVAIEFDGGYALARETECGSGDFDGGPEVRHPARAEPFAGEPPRGVEIAVSGPAMVVFDALGRTPDETTVTISGGGFNGQFVIHEDTGYVARP